MNLLFINVHPNEFSQGLHFYPLAVSLDRCVRSRNTFIDLSRACVPKKTRRFRSTCL